MEMIPDSVWKEIENLIPRKKSKVGRPETDPRIVMNAVFYILKTGIQWRFLPKELGSPSTMHGKFRKWCREGVFDQIMQKAVDLYKKTRLIADFGLQ